MDKEQKKQLALYTRKLAQAIAKDDSEAQDYWQELIDEIKRDEDMANVYKNKEIK